jgi:tetratricopeptide (TPR) repeat protein
LRNRARITAQLIDASTGYHVWAESYDRELDDIFAVQDEITRAITGAVAPEFITAEARRTERKAPKHFDAWDHTMRGNWHIWRVGRENLSEARRQFQAAIDLDPRNVTALSGLALAISMEVIWGWADNVEENETIAYRSAQTAVVEDGNDAWAHTVLGLIYTHMREYEAARSSAVRALQLNPNLAMAEGVLGLACAWLGDYENAMRHADNAARLSPRDLARAWWDLARVVAAYKACRYEEQVKWALAMTEASPDHPSGWRFLASGYGTLGLIDEAHTALQQFLRLLPHASIAFVRDSTPVASPEDLVVMLDGLRKAGLPE